MPGSMMLRTTTRLVRPTAVGASARPALTAAFRRKIHLGRLTTPPRAEPEEKEEEFLTEEEDWTVPGGVKDSLSSNTKLGKAVRGACDELELLSTLEGGVITEANELLQKLGCRNIFHEGTKKMTVEDLEAADREAAVMLEENSDQ